MNIDTAERFTTCMDAFFLLWMSMVAVWIGIGPSSQRVACERCGAMWAHDLK